MIKYNTNYYVSLSDFGGEFIMNSLFFDFHNFLSKIGNTLLIFNTDYLNKCYLFFNEFFSTSRPYDVDIICHSDNYYLLNNNKDLVE